MVEEPDSLIVIKNPTMEDAQHAYAGVTLSWLVKTEHRTSDDTLRILPSVDWKTGPAEFVAWLSKYEKQ
jgi:hypothetical protein